jgi:endonuclease G, mitochondrial
MKQRLAALMAGILAAGISVLVNIVPATNRAYAQRLMPYKWDANWTPQWLSILPIARAAAAPILHGGAGDPSYLMQLRKAHQALPVSVPRPITCLAFMDGAVSMSNSKNEAVRARARESAQRAVECYEGMRVDGSVSGGEKELPTSTASCQRLVGTAAYTNVANMHQMTEVIWGARGNYQNAPIFIARIKLINGRVVPVNTYLIALSGLQDDRNGANENTSPEAILQISLNNKDQYSASVTRAMTELGVSSSDSLLVVGHSLGGLVAQILRDGMLSNARVVTLGAPIIKTRTPTGDSAIHRFWIPFDPVVWQAPFYFYGRYEFPSPQNNTMQVDDGGTGDVHGGFPSSQDLVGYGDLGTRQPYDITLDFNFEYRCTSATNPGLNPLQSACSAEFANGRVPDIRGHQIGATALQQICYWGFAIIHSGAAREPLFAAEHLDPPRMMAAEEVVRHGTFHPEPRIPADQRSELSDYAVPFAAFGDNPIPFTPREGRNSVDDRGHMAPSADMPDPKSDYDSFVLANIVPHDPANNTGLWRQVEMAVRLYAQQHEIYVVTGPIFRTPALAELNGRVMVPWQLYKAVYDPQAKEAVAVISRNSNERTCQLATINQLTDELDRTDVFPGAEPVAHDTLLQIDLLQRLCPRQSSGG